jgi:hypothetical protein
VWSSATYQIRSLGDDGLTEAACEIECRDDEECRQIANGLLADGGFKSIEVWKGTTMIYRTAKGGE